MEVETIYTGLAILVSLALFFLYVALITPGTKPYRFYKDYLNRHLLFYNLRPQYKAYLSKYFDIYNRLSIEEKQNFEKRVQRFIEMKQFISRSPGLEITPEMKVLIAGTAIMMTYGFPAIYLRHFSRILIYDNSYYSTITHKFHKGEVNPKGVIVLSWPAFMDGFIQRKDGRNLGIHEMAHALRLENEVNNKDYNFIDMTVSDKFDFLADKEISKFDKNGGGNSLFRKYAGTNRQEFFAVATEYFYENPESLMNYNRELFELLVIIFRFNPYTLKIISK